MANHPYITHPDSPLTIPPELLQFLEAVFPDRVPPLNMPERDLWAYTGKVELIRYLRSEMERQQEEALPIECVSPA
jgi:hypothetical protein